ncbi:LysE family translocator [Providencia sp. PROV129]|uniref:LysE family translocator n=1 Tax=Providencia sp. PROV129 TaxID=2949839 RepID=UPI00234B971C
MNEIMWFPFVLASLAVIFIPGQDMILVMTKSISSGVGSGLVTALGVSLGLVIHTLIVSFGLGSIIMASDVLFLIIKLCGAIYLFYVAYQLITSDGVISADDSGVGKKSLLSTFFYGALSNVSNPKILIFYLAFLPQFIGGGSGNPVLKMLLMGVVFAALTFIIKAPISIFSGFFSEWFKRKSSVMKWIMRSSGAVLILIGIKVLAEKRA